MAKFGKGYDNIDDAAAAASQALEWQPSMQEMEYVTALFRDLDGKYYRSRFDTAGQAGTAPVANIFREMLDAGQKPEALLHNHPGGMKAKFDPAYLSDADTALGKGSVPAIGQLAMYLLAKGQLRQGTDEKRKTMGSDRQPYFLQSTAPTLAQFPIDELIEHIDRRNPFAAAAAAARKGT